MAEVVFIAPCNQGVTYQELEKLRLSAIEPPTWALMLAASMRAKGFSPQIIDTLAENLEDHELVARVADADPRLICFVVYGQNVNAGTTNMGGVVRQAAALKSEGLLSPIICIGSHVQALPKETLERELAIDIVVLNEGTKALEALLNLEEFSEQFLRTVPGIMFRSGEKIVAGTLPVQIPQQDLELELPGYAWDLLPFKEHPLDLYRSPTWHADYIEEFRSPYAAIQTSIGCQFKCSFCMINLINKNDLSPVSKSSDYAGMRYWSVDSVIREVRTLLDLGVRTIRFTDEMFFLKKARYLPLIEQLAVLNVIDDFRFWAYARIDTVPSPEVLATIRAAGFRWLCLGIESGNKAVRLEVAKGKFEEVDVERVVRQVEEAGINVMANYIFGLPGDTEESIAETYDLSVRLNTLGWNTYAAMALPGSPLYVKAREAGVELPEAYDEFSFHSETSVPLPTDDVPAWRILELRDKKFVEYFGRSEFLAKVSRIFGQEAAETVFKTSRQRLKRLIVDKRK